MSERFKELVKDLNFEDPDGNDIHCSPQGRVKLILHRGEELPVTKNIGTIFETPTGFIYRKKVSYRRHLFRKANAWAIAAYIVQVLNNYDAILEFVTSDYTYRITAAEACEGKWQWFKHQGYERQRIIPLDKWVKLPTGQSHA